MTQFYFDLEREGDPYALPDGETFYVSPLEVNYNKANLDHADDYTVTTPGWYYWACFPGCLPDSDQDYFDYVAVGPFANEKEALGDAREDAL